MTTYDLFGEEATGTTVAADANPYTLGVEIGVDEAGCTLTKIKFWSAEGAEALPTVIALFAVVSETLVHSETASWDGDVASGWVRAAFSSPPALTDGTEYAASVFQPDTVNWYSSSPDWWDTGGPGESGIGNGPVFAPGAAASINGQDCFDGSSALSFPATTSRSPNYWVDVEITPAVTPVSDTETGSGAEASAAGIPASDAGAGADASTLLAGVPGADTGTSAEAALPGIAGPDTGAGAEGGSVDAALPGGDTGTGAEGAIAGISASETSTGAEAGQVAAAIGSAEAGTASDTGTSSASLPAGDAGSGADTGDIGAAASETGSAADAGSATVAESVPELRAALLGGTVTAGSYGGTVTSPTYAGSVT